MRRKLSPLLWLATLFAVGCGSSNNKFGCSRRPDTPPAINISLGIPGETKVENKLPKNDNVHVLEDDETIQFQTESGLARILHHKDRELHVGDIIVANSKQKYLVSVRKIIATEDGSSNVELQQSRIADIVGDSEGSLKIETTPVYLVEDLQKLNLKAQKKKDDGKTYYHTDENGRVVIRNMELFSFGINDDGKIGKGLNEIMGIPIADPYEKLSVSGAAGGRYRAIINEAIIEIVPTVRADIDFHSLAHVETRLDTRVRYKIDITYELAGEIKLEALVDAFMPKKVFPVRVPGPVPVYMDVELGIPAGASILSKAKGKTRVIYESEYEFFSKMTYDKENGVTTDSDQRTVISDKKITTESKQTHMEAEFFLRPSITTRLYRVLGPYAFLKPYVRSEIDWPSTAKKDDLFVGVTGGVGLELSEPIFLKTILSYESGRDLYRFSKSFDLDQVGDQVLPPLGLDPRVDQDVIVDQIGPEGFVVLDLKEQRDNEFFRYELVRGTSGGLLVPSETFYMDGKLYYYPMKGSPSDTFKVEIQANDGRREVVEIAIGTSEDVLEDVSQERFGMTTNSYKVSSGRPGDFAGDVPSFSMGGGGTAVTTDGDESSDVEDKLSETENSKNGDVESFERVTESPFDFLRFRLSGAFFGNPKNSQPLTLNRDQMCAEAFAGITIPKPSSSRKTVSQYSQLCGDLMAMTANFDSQFGPKRSTINGDGDWIPRREFHDLKVLSDKLTKVEKVRLDKKQKSITFNFYNMSLFDQYFLFQKQNKTCQPRVKVTVLEEEEVVGLRITKTLCGAYEAEGEGFLMSANNLSAAFGIESLEWGIRSETQNGNSILELRLSKPEAYSALRDRDGETSEGSLYLAFSLFGTRNQIFVQDQPPQSKKSDVSVQPYYDEISAISVKSLQLPMSLEVATDEEGAAQLQLLKPLELLLK